MPDLTTLANVKAWLPAVAPSNTTADPLLQSLIDATSADFLRACNRPDLLQAGYTEIRVGDGSTRLALRHWPIDSITTLTIAGTAIAATPDGVQPGWYLDGDGDPELNFVLYLTGNVFPDGQTATIHYSAGYAAVPLDVQQAVTEWVALRYSRRLSIGQTQNRTSEGEHTDFTADDLPPNTKRIIERYTRAKPAYATPPTPAEASPARGFIAGRRG